MSLQHLEFKLAYELISHATEVLEPQSHPEDVDAAVVAALATALEIASNRFLKPLEDIYEKRIRHQRPVNAVYED